MFLLFSLIGLPGADGMPGGPGLSGPVGIVEDTSGTGVSYLYNVFIFNEYFIIYCHLFSLLKLLKNIVKKIFEL
jgi:hypothetical protein